MTLFSLMLMIIAGQSSVCHTPDEGEVAWLMAHGTRSSE
jgi:hypothetical protein